MKNPTKWINNSGSDTVSQTTANTRITNGNNTRVTKTGDTRVTSTTVVTPKNPTVWS